MLRRTVVLHGRAALIWLAAGVLVAVGLVVLDVVAGPQVCVVPAVCAPPPPGETGCGPVPATCSGTALSLQVVTASSLGTSLPAGVVLWTRRSR